MIKPLSEVRSGKELCERGVAIAMTGEWFTRKDLGSFNGTKEHDVQKHIKSRGYKIEFENTGNGSKRFRWTGEMQPTGSRSGAANKARKLLPTPDFCPFTSISDSGQTPYVMDHRDGRIVGANNDYPTAFVTIDNVADLFMWVNPSANATKREGCIRCEKTGIKEPARVGSRSIAQGPYEGTCKGCYWYDPDAWFIANGIH